MLENSSLLATVRICALVLAQLVCRLGPNICRAAVGDDGTIAIAHPTLKCTQA